MHVIRQEIASDGPARERLLDRAFGRQQRRRKTSERLRSSRLPAEGLAFTALDGKGRPIGTLRLWNVVAGTAGAALLLGPLAVDCRHQGRGVGSDLMRHALAVARSLGHGAVMLVGDAPYYARFGFAHGPVEGLSLPGPVERQRFLGLELTPGGLAGATGMVAAAGRRAPAVSRAA